MPEGHGSVFAQFAKLSNSKEEPAGTDQSSKQLPKGVVLGKDGKPYEHYMQYDPPLLTIPLQLSNMYVLRRLAGDDEVLHETWSWQENRRRRSRRRKSSHKHRVPTRR